MFEFLPGRMLMRFPGLVLRIFIVPHYVLSFFTVISSGAQLRNLRFRAPDAQEAEFLLTASDTATFSHEKTRIAARASSNRFF